MSEAPSISLNDQIACLKREIAMRKNVYPKWVNSGRMKQDEADKEIARMTAALHTILAIQEALAGEKVAMIHDIFKAECFPRAQS